MTPLVIGPEEIAALLKMKEHARANPLTMEALKAIMAGGMEPVHLHPEEHYVQLPFGFEVGITYELQEHALWHVSFSVHREGRVIHPLACDFILKEIGLPPLAESVGYQMFGNVANVWFLDEEERSVSA